MNADPRPATATAQGKNKSWMRPCAVLVGPDMRSVLAAHRDFQASKVDVLISTRISKTANDYLRLLVDFPLEDRQLKNEAAGFGSRSQGNHLHFPCYLHCQYLY